MPTIATWNTDGSSPAVEYARETLEQVRRHALLGFLSVPKIGAGAGGLLLGERTAGGVRILDSVEIPCSHAFGPSFALTEAEIAAAVALAQHPRELSVVGWYVSRTRGPIEMAERDLALYRTICPEQWQLALVLQPSAVHTTKAVLCHRDDSGVILRGPQTSVDPWAAPEEDLSDLESADSAGPVVEVVAPVPVTPVVPQPPSSPPVAQAPPPPPPVQPPPPAPRVEEPPAQTRPPVASRPNVPQRTVPQNTTPSGEDFRPSKPRPERQRFAPQPDIPNFRHDVPSDNPGILPIRPQFSKETAAPIPGREVNQSTKADPRARGVIPIRPKFDAPARDSSVSQPYAGPFVPQPKTRRFWSVIGSVALALLVLAAYVVKDIWIPRVPLKLEITESKGEVTLQWNRDGVAGIEQASLILNDGGQLQSVLLDSKQLAKGVFTAKHKSDRVTAIIRLGEERILAVWDAPSKLPAPAAQAVVEQAVTSADPVVKPATPVSQAPSASPSSADGGSAAPITTQPVKKP